MGVAVEGAITLTGLKVEIAVRTLHDIVTPASTDDLIKDLWAGAAGSGWTLTLTGARVESLVDATSVHLTRNTLAQLSV